MMQGYSIFKKTIIASLIIFSNQNLYAARGEIIPGSAEPGVISNYLSTPSIQSTAPPKAAALPKEPEQTASKLGPQASKIKFKLTKVILEDNVTYSTAELQKLYQDKINKTITIAELEGIVQSITNYYRNNGYILSRAILPPQHVSNGTVKIRVIEGYISKVNVQGDPKRAKYILQKYGDNIAAERPTKVENMEHYLRISNEIPGMTARAVLEPSKSQVGASDLNLVAQEKTWGAYMSYDNYGTRYIGPNQVTASVSGNSVFQSGDATTLTTVRTSRPLQLKYVDVNHDFPIGGKGLRTTLGINQSLTQPGLNLALLKTEGDAVTAYGRMQYPVWRTRTADLTLDGGLNYIDSGVTNFGFFNLYTDHIRNATLGGSGTFSDKHSGTNLYALHLEQGLPILGFSNNPNSPSISRVGADGVYTKFTGNLGRLQSVYKRVSAFIYATGQYSFQPLLASTQFAFGGSQLGRGYDPAEIIGDRGIGGTLEMRYDTAPAWRFLENAQFYAFYDAGEIWNLKNVLGIPKKQSLTSTGFGVRFSLTKNFSGNLMWAQPLTKLVAAEEFVGQGSNPRGYFSIVGTI